MSHPFYPRDPLIDSFFLWPHTTVRYEVVTYPPPPHDDATATKHSGEAAAAAPATKHEDDATFAKDLVEKGYAASAMENTADTKKEESARIAGELREALQEAGFLGKDVAATKETAATTGNACTAAQNVAAEFCERQRALLTAPGGPVDKAVAAARVQMEQLRPRAAVFVHELGLGMFVVHDQDAICNTLVAELEKRGFHSGKVQLTPRRVQPKGAPNVLCHWDCPWLRRKAGTDDPQLCTCGSMIVFEWWPKAS